MLSKARIKTTNLSMAMVLIFIMTNLPYIVDEFLRQGILLREPCHSEFCLIAKVEIFMLMAFDFPLSFRPFLEFPPFVTQPSILTSSFCSVQGLPLLSDSPIVAVPTPNHSRIGEKNNLLRVSRIFLA